MSGSKTQSVLNDDTEESTRAIAPLLLASTLTVMAAAIIAPSLPSMRAAFSDTPHVDVLVRLVLTTPALLIVLGSPLAGALVDRVGRKPVLVVGMLTYALAGVSGAVLNSLHLILIGRALLGLSVAGLMTAATTLITDLFDGERRDHVLGMQASFMGLGGSVFLLLGGIVATFNWHYPFYVYLAGLPIALLAIARITESAVADEDENHRAHDQRRVGRPWPVILVVVPLVVTIQVLFYLVPVQLPFLLESRGESRPWVSGGLISAASLCFATSSWYSARVRRAFGLRGTVALGYALAAIGYAALGIFEALPLMSLALIIGGSGFGLVMPSLNAWLASSAPPLIRGSVMSTFTTAVFLGQFLSPLLFQNWIDARGVESAYLLAAPIAVLAGLVAWTRVAREATVEPRRE